MFQRLKGAIDNRIAEEQARQRQAVLQSQPGKSQPPRQRPQGQNGGTQRVSSRPRDPSTLSPDQGPDPAEFEPEFAIGDDDSAVPSRTATPRPGVKDKEKAQDQEQDSATGGTDADERASAPGARQSMDKDGAAAAPVARPQEVPTDIRVKLRRLDRIESKYAELLKAYKMAHARLQAVDSFEASLRENTPLTSINDPGAMVEYLNQTNLKSDMVLEELKRVTTERDACKRKLQASEDEATNLREEVAGLKAHAAGQTQPDTVAITDASPATAPADAGAVKDAGEPRSPASASSRIPSFTLFSPRSKPASSPPKETSEDLFSFESEHQKVELELQESRSDVEELKRQVVNLQNDLKVARESTGSMVETLESTTRELHGLRDAKDKFDETKRDLQDHIDKLESKAASHMGRIDELQTELNDVQSRKDLVGQQLLKLESEIKTLKETNTQLRNDAQSVTKDASLLNEKLSQKDHVVKDLEDTLAMYKSAERQDNAQKDKNRDATIANDKKLTTMQNIMDTLRGQLDTAEKTIAHLKAQMQHSQEEFSKLPSNRVFGFLDEKSKSKVDELSSREEIVSFLADNFDLQRAIPNHMPHRSDGPAVAPSEIATNASKKKNKKKKKGKGPQTPLGDNEGDAPVKVSENLADVDENESVSRLLNGADVAALEKEVAELKGQLSDKVNTAERLLKQLKDQEALQEEIETLRDDLLHQGEEHVEARDALKDAQAQKKSLQETVDKLEAELTTAQKAAAAGVVSEKSHQAMIEQIDELKGRCVILEKELAASEQLAANRFKDISDLKDLLAKAQPELRNLRSEVAELKSAKEDLKNKAGELSRLEARHDDIKAELKGLSKRLGEKDTEIKELQQKIEQETQTRVTAERDLDKVQLHLQTTESRRQAAVSSSEKLTKDLSKAKDEAATLKAKLRGMEEQISTHDRRVAEFREEISLKSALHSSSQSLVQSLRDQTHELNMQAREATSRADSLEEELAECQRMLSERTREGQTMRMLLDQSETGTESRIREMKERMDVALEERDRVEDEASVSNRRMMREVEQAKSKARDAQRALTLLEHEKEDLEQRQQDWKRRRDDLEDGMARATKEVDEVRLAMTGLREALDESERQLRDLDAQKVDLRRTADEAKERVDILTKANKNLTEELKAAQSGGKGLRVAHRPGTGPDSGGPSSRTSIDSGGARSPAPKERVVSTSTSRSETPATAGLSQGTVDYVYLKNVLLQFLEQKDKGHQRQLIPVLAMLLHFDRKDEQKWIAAIAAR